MFKKLLECSAECSVLSNIRWSHTIHTIYIFSLPHMVKLSTNVTKIRMFTIYLDLCVSDMFPPRCSVFMTNANSDIPKESSLNLMMVYVKEITLKVLMPIKKHTTRCFSPHFARFQKRFLFFHAPFSIIVLHLLPSYTSPSMINMYIIYTQPLI